MEGERVRRQMQEVAVENYSAFISAAEAISFVKTQLEDFDKHLELLVLTWNYLYYHGFGLDHLVLYTTTSN